MYVDPAAQTVAAGATASVDIRVETQQELAGYGFRIAWDPSVLALISIVNQPFLGSTGRTVACSIGEGVGNAIYRCQTTGSLPGPTGDGALATVQYLALADGVSAVDLVVVQLVDITMTQIPLEITDGTVVVKSQTETPPPVTTTPSLTPGVLPSPVPPPVPDSGFVLHLHNNPSPPVGDTASQPVLLMDQQTPSVATLYNYDRDRDAEPGLLIVGSASDGAEGDGTKTQVWRTDALPAGIALGSGAARVTLWYNAQLPPGPPGRIIIYLRHFDGLGYTELGTGSISVPGSRNNLSSWTAGVASIGGTGYTVPAGGFLELKLVLEAPAGAGISFAYDTTRYDSYIELP